MCGVTVSVRLALRGEEGQFLFQDEFCIAMFLAEVADFGAV